LTWAAGQLTVTGALRGAECSYGCVHTLLDLGISFAVREERTETGITVRAAPSSLWWGTIGSERTVT